MSNRTEETPPRYASKSWLVDTADGEVFEVVDRKEYTRGWVTSAPVADWWAMKTALGEIEWDGTIGLPVYYYQPIHQRRELPEGWEYTGKAAFIDGGELLELHDGECWVASDGTLYDAVAYIPVADVNEWRHLARKKNVENPPPTRAEMVADPNCPVGKPPANVPYDALGYR
jgi:hypothetical protein